MLNLTRFSGVKTQMFFVYSSIIHKEHSDVVVVFWSIESILTFSTAVVVQTVNCFSFVVAKKVISMRY